MSEIQIGRIVQLSDKPMPIFIFDKGPWKGSELIGINEDAYNDLRKRHTAALAAVKRVEELIKDYKDGHIQWYADFVSKLEAAIKEVPDENT